MPDYLQNLQKLEKAATAFATTEKYNRKPDILKLNWMPTKERLDFAVLKLFFKFLQDQIFGLSNASSSSTIKFFKRK